MALWTVITVMCSIAAVLVSVPLIRRYEHRKDLASAGTNIFTDQLKELERDRNLGLIDPSDADLAKTEIERRLIAAARNVTEPRPISPMWRIAALASAAGLVILGSVNIYAVRGRPDLIQPPPASMADSAQTPAQIPQDTTTTAATGAFTTGEVATMIDKLAKRLEANPKDADGWRMLGWSYFNTQRFDDSAAAYARAVALTPTNLDYKSAYAEALVQAAQGIVVPKAQEIFAEVLKADPKEERARFYDALAREQAGDLPLALDRWIALLADAPENAGWVPDVKQRVADLGQKTKRDVSGVLANAPVLPNLAESGVAQVDQQAMVDDMIGKLAAKLEANPHDRDGWAMMIRSLKVKGDMEGAKASLTKALAIFADDPATGSQLADMGRSLGIASDANNSSALPSAPALSQETVASVQALPAEDQQVMIKAMVQRLADKLVQSPHDADGWIRLIRARMVLNETDLARDALKKAVTEFSGDLTASNQIVTAARQLGMVVD